MNNDLEKAAEFMQQQAAQQGSNPNPGNESQEQTHQSTSNSKKDDDVIDADFTD